MILRQKERGMEEEKNKNEEKWNDNSKIKGDIAVQTTIVVDWKKEVGGKK